jgi:hypothetical protein
LEVDVIEICFSQLVPKTSHIHDRIALTSHKSLLEEQIREEKMSQIASGELTFDTVLRLNKVPHSYDPSVINEHVDFLGDGVNLMRSFADGSIVLEIDVDEFYRDGWVDFVDLFDDRCDLRFISTG